jgi:ABC-type uncharacterized transport system auxiliary subunit
VKRLSYIKIASLFGLGLFMLGGCTLQNKVPPVSKYQLDVSTDVTATEVEGCKEKVVRLGLIESSVLLSGRNIYYSTDDAQSFSYTKARWIEPLNNQLANLIEQSITKREIFKEVIPIRSLARNDLMLESSIYDFSQKIHADGTTTLHLSMKFVLMQQYERTIIATKFFDISQDEEEGNIVGALKGYNTLVQQLLEETNSWLEESCSK